MIIDVQNIKCMWINLDSATDCANNMVELFDKTKITKHERLSARILPCPEGTRESEKHYVGVGQSHIDCLKSIEGDFPAMILEDDVALTETGELFFNSKHPKLLEVPDETDAIYLGTSHGDGRYTAVDIGGGFARIYNVLAAHAIVYTSERYIKAVQDVAKHCIYEVNKPFDIGTYRIQENFNVIATHKPFFYQKSQPEALNNWEDITKHPLNIKPFIPVGPRGMQ